MTLPAEIPPLDHPDLLLVRRSGRLALLDRSLPRQHPLAVDFSLESTARRAHGLGRRRHPLARAVGRRAPLPLVLDGTAGLGRDAFTLASLGYRVVAVERSPVLYALLADGVARILDTEAGRDRLGDRLTVLPGDCRERFDPAPEVVYLDPMFPHREKSALVKKEMQMLQKLLCDGSDPDEEARDLLDAARRAARQRVVVKRPRGAPALAADVSYAVTGTRVRWDVYLTG